MSTKPKVTGSNPVGRASASSARVAGPPDSADTERVMSEENVETVREMFEAWNRRDYEAAQERFDPEVEIEIAAESALDASFRGHSGLREMVRFWGAFAEFRSEPEEFRAAGDKVFVTVHHSGRGKTSGVDVDMRQWQVFTVRGDRIVRYRIYGSRERALEAAGLSE
jgi:ketosteroid isomerase-like protein